MGRTAQVQVAFVALLLWSGLALGQEPAPEPPGPYVIDLRGAVAGIPNGTAFFPTVPLTDTAAIPARGFGFDVGAHVYPFRLGVARIGVGANLMRVRGSLSDPAEVSAIVTTLAPQLSFNFGSRSGWSYLSAGYGGGEVNSDAEDGPGRSGRVSAINVGGGARWFLSDHVAFGFDIRFHRLGAGDTTPSARVFGASVGLSLR